MTERKRSANRGANRARAGLAQTGRPSSWSVAGRGRSPVRRFALVVAAVLVVGAACSSDPAPRTPEDGTQAPSTTAPSSETSQDTSADSAEAQGVEFSGELPDLPMPIADGGTVVNAADSAGHTVLLLHYDGDQGDELMKMYEDWLASSGATNVDPVPLEGGTMWFGTLNGSEFKVGVQPPVAGGAQTDFTIVVIEWYG